MIPKTIKNYERIKRGIELYKGEMYMYGDYDDVAKVMSEDYNKNEIEFIRKEAGY